MERETRFAAVKVALQQRTRGLCFQAFWLAAANGVFGSDEPVTLVMLPFRHFCFCSIFLSFNCPFDSNIAIFYRII